MRDVDDPGAARAQAPNDLKETLDLAIGERGRRLVHHDDPRRSREDLGDLDQLLLSDGEARHRLVERNLESEFAERALGARAHRPSFDQSGARRFAAERDVRGCRKLRDERKLLVDHPDAEMLRLLRGRDVDGLAVDANFAFVRLQRAG